MNSQRWQDWITALAGAWIFLTPWVIGSLAGGSPGGMVDWSHFIIGGLTVLLSLGALFAYQIWEEWGGVVLGLITIALPWLLGFSGTLAFTLSDVIAGAIIVVLAGWMAIAHPEGMA